MLLWLRRLAVARKAQRLRLWLAGKSWVRLSFRSWLRPVESAEVKNNIMFNLMTPFTQSFEIGDNIVIPVPVFMVNYKKSSGTTSFTSIFTKLSVSLDTTFPHRVFITRVIKLSSVTSIMAKSRAIFRRAFECSKVSFGFMVGNLTKATYKLNRGSFVMRSLSLNKWSTTHANSVSPNISSVNGSKKMAKMSAAGRKRGK